MGHAEGAEVNEISNKVETAFGASRRKPGERRLLLTKRRRVALGMPEEDFGRILRQIFCSIRNRAVRRGQPHLTKEDVWTLWRRAAGHCQVSGIKFSLQTVRGTSMRPWAPSIDRINSRGTYEIDNCRFVCTAVNLAMSQWGEKVLMTIVTAMARKLYIGEVPEKSGETSMFPVKP
jgi:hypothetical protein